MFFSSFTIVMVNVTHRTKVGTLIFKYKENPLGNLSFKEALTFKISLELKYSVQSSILSKITPVVCLGTHTKPLILIGSVPTNTMGPRFHTPRLVGGVPGAENGC